MKLAGYRLVDRYSTRDTAQDVAVNYAPSKIVKRREKWEVWTKQGLKKRNLFGFGKTVTHSTKLSSQAYEAGRRSGDTAQFRSWWDRQTSGGEKFSGKLKRHAEQRYRAGVESLWKEEKKAEAKVSAEDAKTVQADVVEALIGQQFTKSAARAAVKRHYKSGDTFDSLFRKAIGSGKTSKMSANRSMSKMSKMRSGLSRSRATHKSETRSPRAGDNARLHNSAPKWLVTFDNEAPIEVVAHNRQDAIKWASIRRGDRGPHPVKPWKKVKVMRHNPSKTPLRRLLERLTTAQQDMVTRGMDSMYYTAIEQGFKPAEAEKLADQKALSLAKKYAAENPAKFDRCVSDVKKSLKKYKRPGNAYAICTKAGTRNRRNTKRFKIYVPGESRGSWRFSGDVIEADSPREAKEIYRSRYNLYVDEPLRTLPESAPWPKGGPKNPKRSARARAKVAHRSRPLRKAPKTKRSKNASVVWSAHQGKITAQVTRSLSGYRVKLFGGKRVFEEFPAKHFDEAVSIARLRLADTSAQNPKKDQDFVSQVIPGVSQADALARAVQRVGKGVTHAAKRTTRGVLKRFRGRRAKNPIATAQKMYEDFHGEPSKEILEIVEERHHHEVVAAVGQLVSLLVEFPNGKTLPLNAPGFSEKISNGRKFWEFDEKTPLIKRVLVTTSEDGKQLFLDGGDQGISNDELKKLGFTDRDIHDHMVLGEIKMITYRTQKSFEAKGREAVDFWHKFGSEGSKGVLPTLLYYPRSKKLKIAGGRYYIASPDRSLGNVSPGIEG